MSRLRRRAERVQRRRRPRTPADRVLAYSPALQARQLAQRSLQPVPPQRVFAAPAPLPVERPPLGAVLLRRHLRRTLQRGEGLHHKPTESDSVTQSFITRLLPAPNGQTSALTCPVQSPSRQTWPARRSFLAADDQVRVPVAHRAGQAGDNGCARCLILPTAGT